MGKKLHLFDGYGIELEYMIVDQKSLSVLPISDRILHTISGDPESEVDRGELNWSNELVLHVIELKTHGPADSLESLPEIFQKHIQEISHSLNPMDARLMPTSMHPWMNPLQETKMWPHEYNAVYESFDRIFGCRGHGWSNIQSMHINLPFANDKEFERLHAAIRLVLPIVPVLAASSPIVEGKLTGTLDNRLEFYRHNQEKIPSLSGLIIPEPLYTRKDYQNKLLKKLYRDIAPFDIQGTLSHEWLNSRGAIARFDRNTIEIRLIDMQECPLSDLTVAAAVISVIRSLISEQWTDLEDQKYFPTNTLSNILLGTIKHADHAVLDNPDYLRLFGLDKTSSLPALKFWEALLNSMTRYPLANRFNHPIETILKKGTLASRIVQSLGDSFSHAQLQSVYKGLADCLLAGEPFA